MSRKIERGSQKEKEIIEEGKIETVRKRNVRLEDFVTLFPHT